MKNLRVMPRSARSMAGVSLVELMIAMLLGLVILAGLATIFANSSRSREEIERTSRQIENGRYAMETLSEDLRLAGFYGEVNILALPNPTALPDPCSTDPLVWTGAVKFHVQGYDNGTGAPVCVPGRKVGTDVLVIRRAAACEAGIAGCAPVQNSLPYVQASKCGTEAPGTPFVLNTGGSGVHTLRLRNCATVARVRQYFVRIYYISDDNGSGVAIPTLKRADFTGSGWVETPLVEGIEQLNIEYGIDWHGATVADPSDGSPDTYLADPTTQVPVGCGTCTAVTNWLNVVTARINLVARNIDPSAGYNDTKTYTIGRNAANAEINIVPPHATYTDAAGVTHGYRRHGYAGLVRVVNAAERRDQP